MIPLPSSATLKTIGALAALERKAQGLMRSPLMREAAMPYQIGGNLGGAAVGLGVGAHDALQAMESGEGDPALDFGTGALKGYMLAGMPLGLASAGISLTPRMARGVLEILAKRNPGMFERLF